MQVIRMQVPLGPLHFPCDALKTTQVATIEPLDWCPKAQFTVTVEPSELE